MSNRLILASASPRRKELLEQVGLSFTVYPSSVPEYINPELPIEKQVEDLALQKAQDVAKDFEDCLVLGADTVVVINGDVLGKPTNTSEAFAMLKRLRGNEHVVITGIAILNLETGKVSVGHEKTFVTMKNFSDTCIKHYVESGEPMDKAGSYAIQGYGALLVEKIKGEFSNVVGLSLNLTASLLLEMGVDLLKFGGGTRI